jgi:OOP family OmpA-OmpF porin
MIHMRKLLLLSVLTASLFQTQAMAEDGMTDPGTWRFNPAIGLQVFDDDRRLDNAGTLIGGLEYRYNQDWGVEVSLMSSSPDSDDGSDVDLLQLGVDGLYFFSRDDLHEAYWILGLANADFDGGIGSEMQIHGGAGIRFAVNDQWSLRTSAKLIKGTEDSDLDTLVTFGLSYAFGQSGKAIMAPKPQQDSDGDGVMNDTDQCPNTPAGVQVDERGCALDGDQDGVPDYKDQCPTTPAGREVDEKGCKFVLTKTVEIELKVNFATNASEVPGSYVSEVEALADFMKKYADVDAKIEGHTDSRGAASYNKPLSQRRADAVKDMLVNRFAVDAARVSAMGYGEEQPVADNDTAAGRSANRRVVAVMKATVEE